MRPDRVGVRAAGLGRLPRGARGRSAGRPATRRTVRRLPAGAGIAAAARAPGPERPLPLDALLEQAERRLIELALRRAKGHRGRAAEILGIWRARLLRRIAALGLAGPESGDDEG